MAQLTREQALKAIEEAGASYRERYLAAVGDADAEARRLAALLCAGAPAGPVRVRLKALGRDAWPLALLECYRRAGRAENRQAFVYRAIPEARDSEAARELGLMALHDRAKSVRWRAHQLLAYSLDPSVLPTLEDALNIEPRPELRESLKAAIAAVAARNHHLFKDRRGRGNVRWVVMPWEGTDPLVNRTRLRSRIGEIVTAWQTEL